MSDSNPPPSPPKIKPTLQVIHSVVAECFGINLEELPHFSEEGREKAAPKHVALWLAKRLTDCPDQEITSYFGVHPVSLLDAERRVTKHYNEDTLFRETLDSLTAYLSDPEKIREVMDFSNRKTPRVTVHEIQKAAAAHFGLKQADLISEARARSIARPRQAAMWLAKQLTTRSLPDLGRRFGGRDHTTVLHGVRKIEELRAQDPDLQSSLEMLVLKLTGKPLPQNPSAGQPPTDVP